MNIKRVTCLLAIVLHSFWAEAQIPDTGAPRVTAIIKITNNYETATMQMTSALAHAVSTEKTDEIMRLLTKQLTQSMTNQADWRHIRLTVSREILTNLMRLEMGTKECSLVTNIDVRPPPGKLSDFMGLQYSPPSGGVTNIEDPELRAFGLARSTHARLWNAYMPQAMAYFSHLERSLKHVAQAYSSPTPTDAEIRELMDGFDAFDFPKTLAQLLPKRSD